MERFLTRITGFLLTLLVVSTAQATEFYAGQTVEVAKNDTLPGDLYGAGESIFIWGVVEGDATIAGRSVEMSGSVAQDLWAAGELVTVNGIVGDDLRAAGRIISIHGVIGDDVFAFGAQVNVHEDAVILGNLFASGGVVRMDGTIRGSFQANGDEVYFGGEVGGDVTLKAGKKMVISPSALVYQDLTYSFRDSVELAGREQVSGRIFYEREIPKKDLKEKLGLVFIALRVWFLIGSVAVGLILLLAFPSAARKSLASMRGGRLSVVGLGILGFLGIPIGSVLLAILIITLPAAIVVFSSYLLMLYFGYLAAALFTGDWLMRRLDRTDTSLYLSFLTGLAGLFLLGLIPYVGFVVRWLAVVYGLGGLAAAQFSKQPAE